jgi:hypothetical protein
MNHTQEQLEALPRKADVQEIAESLGLSTDGTRKEVTDRILEHQAAGASAEEAAPDAPTDSDAGDADSAPEPDDQEPPAPPTDPVVPKAPADAAAEPVTVERAFLNAKAERQAQLLLESYFGKGSVPPEALATTLTALKEGQQPCVVRGTGNAKFAVSVYAHPFNKNTPATDNPEKGVLLNIARRLARAGLYPNR